MSKEGYCLYDNKANKGTESIEGLSELEKEIKDAGYSVAYERGDALTDSKNV